MASFESERLIMEVKNRPALWDTSAPEYNSRTSKDRGWDEIVDIFKDGELTLEQRILLVDAVQKKWKSIRGCYTRELNRKRRLKCGPASGLRKREYIYFEQLKFLENVATIKEDDSLEDASGADKPVAKQRKVKKKNNIKQSPCVTKSVQKREMLENQDEDELFLLSLLGTLKRVPPQKKMATKIKIMAVLERATQSVS